MHWLLTTHASRYLRRCQATGHVWQGRLRAFPIQEDDHLLTVLRYIERNPLRAGLVERAESWRWSSLRSQFDKPRISFLHSGPLKRPENWVEWVNAAQTEAELKALRRCVERGTPFGETDWVTPTAARLGLEYTLRSRGRPPKEVSAAIKPVAATLFDRLPP